MDTKTAPKTESQSRGKWTSASAAEPDVLCPGRHIAQLGIVDTSSPDAETGNKIHAALAKQDPAGLNVEDTETYESCVKIEEELVIRYFGPEVANLKAIPDREQRKWIEWTDQGGLRHSGQADAVYRYKSKCLIIDYKTGRDEAVGSPKNMQLRDLAVVNFVNRPLLSEVGVAIIQPFVTRTPEVCVYTPADIKKAILYLLSRVKASNDSSSPRVAGELQCKYCRAKGRCAEYNKWAGSLVSTVGMLNVLDVAVENWSPEQRSTFLNNAGRAGKWLNDCLDKMKSVLKEQPDAIPGWTLKPGVMRETITKPQEVFDRFSKLGGSLEQFMDCIKVVKTDLKEQVAAATKQKGKALTSTMETLVAGCTESKETDPSLKKSEAP